MPSGTPPHLHQLLVVMEKCFSCSSPFCSAARRSATQLKSHSLPHATDQSNTIKKLPQNRSNADAPSSADEGDADVDANDNDGQRVGMTKMKKTSYCRMRFHRPQPHRLINPLQPEFQQASADAHPFQQLQQSSNLTPGDETDLMTFLNTPSPRLHLPPSYLAPLLSHLLKPLKP